MTVLDQSIVALGRQLRARQVSAVELAKAALELAESNVLNAYVDVRREYTLDQARAADTLLTRLAQQDQAADMPAGGALLGIPVAHKDIFVTRGWRSTAGSRMLGDYTSPFDATVVERTEAAGAVCIGKLNCDEFAMGSGNENSHFGAVANPWATDRVPGGSSGGSAAAVAAGMVPMATGTDTGGSVRQPASFCGITGIKPTYGRVSRFGMIAYASSLDQAGVMARSAEDCACLLGAIAGFDARDSTSIDAPVPDWRERVQQRLRAAPGDGSKPLAGVRVGLPAEFFGEGLAADVRSAVEAGTRALQGLGAELVEVHLPRTALSIPSYYVIAPAEASSNLSRFDGVRYGHRASDYDGLREMYMRTRAEGFGAEVRRRILIGAYVLSTGYYDAFYRKAQQLRRLIAGDFDRVFGEVDLIAGPVAPTTAWARGGQASDPVRDYLADIYTLPASLAGLPAMSLPCGCGDNGLPVGMQLIAPAMDEEALLHAAIALQNATDWHQRRPVVDLSAPVPGLERRRA